MNPSKIRERKCSTCKHYQPSPLWRKGWCRNPLLYDRNTNHLVEADSLACNRTFIDYWEPISGPSPTATAGTAGRTSAKPRIAPSIPMEMTDARGQRVTRTGITPMSGMAAVTADEVEEALTADELAYVEASDLDYDLPNGGQSTMELAQIEGVSPNGAETGPVPALTRAGERAGAKTATRKAKAVRQPQRPIIFGMGRDRLILIGVTGILLLIAIAAGAMLLGQPNKIDNPGVSPTITVAPAPSPTGFGDPTATAPPAPTSTTPPPPPSDVIAVGGYVEATSNVTLRSEATTAGARLGVLQSGTKAHVIEGPLEANGYTWWKLDGYDSGNPQASGWCAGEFLRPIPPP